MNTSDLSFSKCSFSVSEFFMQSGFLFSRFSIALIGTIDNFQTIGIKLSLKFTNASFKSINFTLLLQDFRFRFCE